MINLSNKEIKVIVDQEGLGNTIQNIIESDAIKDPVIRFAWKETKELLNYINEKLFSSMNEIELSAIPRYMIREK